MLRSRRVNRRRNVETAELNITAFMNLMVILVPFLLITAVFSRLAVLELNLPGSSAEPVEQEKLVFQLEIIIRDGRIEVGDRTVGTLGVFPRDKSGEYDFDALSAKLREIKRSYPDKTDASILLESEISYDTLVQVMDRVRVAITVEDGSAARNELFPEISIGDAPIVSGGA